MKNLAKAGAEFISEKKYNTLLQSKKMSFDSWIRQEESGLSRFDMTVSNEAGNEMGKTLPEVHDANAEYVAKISGTNFRIIPMAKCGQGFTVKRYLEDVLIFTNGELTDKAFPLILSYFASHPQCFVIYGDEDMATIDATTESRYGKTVQGTRHNPYFKADWSPNAFLSHFYFCNIVAIKRANIRDMEWTGDLEGASSLYHNLIRFIFADEKSVKYGVGHIPEILIHANDYSNNAIFDETAARLVAKFTKLPELSENKKISVIVCTKDHPDMLDRCLENLYHAAEENGIDLETVVIDNGSIEENREKNVDIQLKYMFRYEYEVAEFNYSKMCNHGASLATSDMLLFLNDDVDIEDPAALARMYEEASRSFSGAVGIKLLYPGGEIIQHAGVINNRLGPVHKLQGLSDSYEHYFRFNRYTQNVLAATGACLMVRTELFRQVGGFDEELAVAYNDVDLCYKLAEAGYMNVVCNDVFGIHKESVTRGYDENTEKTARLLRERTRLYKMHPLVGHTDPFYNKRLLSDALDARIVPAYEFSYEYCVENAVLSTQHEVVNAREDACLDVRVEFAGMLSEYLGREDEEDYYVQGYMVVHGSNNACYLKHIVLEMNGEKTLIPFEGCIRMDVAKAFSEDKNVELCGFAIRIAKDLIPTGNYRVGGFVQREYSSEKLINFSDKLLVVRETV